MESRCQVLRKIALSNRMQPKQVNSLEQLPKRNYLDKCKSFIKSINSKSNSSTPSLGLLKKKKIARNLARDFSESSNKENAGDETDSIHKQSSNIVAKVSTQSQIPPTQGQSGSSLFLMWRGCEEDGPNQINHDDNIHNEVTNDEMNNGFLYDSLNADSSAFGQDNETNKSNNEENIDEGDEEDHTEEVENIANYAHSAVMENYEIVDNPVHVETAPIQKNKGKAVKISNGVKSKRAVHQSFKNGFLTLKSNLMKLQKKNGLEADFLLVMRNNAQKVAKRNSSQFADKCLVVGAGELHKTFISSNGLQFDPAEFLILKNAEGAMEVDQEHMNIAIQNMVGRSETRTETRTPIIRRSESSDNAESTNDTSESDDELDAPIDLYNMKRVAKKVSTPGSSLLDDPGTLVYGNGNDKVTPELKKQRENASKARKEANKKIRSDVLSQNSDRFEKPVANLQKNKKNRLKTAKKGKGNRCRF